MTTALDPTFVKALKLLQSKSKDSTAQLRAMLDEAIAVRRGYGTPQSQSSRSPNGSKDTSRSVSRERPELERKEVEKRKDLDRLKADLNQLEPKRPRLNSPALSNSSHESPDSPAGSEGSQGDYGELQMNIELDCTCIICKSFNQESNNKLMECSSCQNLYHQECHEPPVSNSEASDPRLIWNCSRCTRKNPHSSSSSSRSTSVEKISSKSDSRPPEKSSKHSSSSSSSSSHKSSKHHKPSPSKVSSKHKSSSSGSSLGSGSSGQASSVQMTEAQKRLKLMKKQAAAASLGKKKAK